MADGKTAITFYRENAVFSKLVYIFQVGRHMISRNNSLKAKTIAPIDGIDDEYLRLSLGSLQSPFAIKETLDKTEKLPSTFLAYPSGSLTQRDQAKPQKKLNCSVKASQPPSVQHSHRVSFVLPTKPTQLSIFRTVSLAYVSHRPKSSRLVPHIRKSQTMGEEVIQNKEESHSDEIGYDMGASFATVKVLTSNCRLAHDQRKTNNVLIKANEVLLQEIKHKDHLAIAKDKAFADLQRQLEEEFRGSDQMKRQILFLEEDRRRKQEKVTAQQKKNEALVREINTLKVKINNNLKDLQVLRTEDYNQFTNSMSKRSWSLTETT